jgi:hypothetical protein
MWFAGSAMLALPTPLRATDLTHTQQAVLLHAEQIAAYGRLPAEQILPNPWGLLLNQTDAERTWRGPMDAAPERGHFVNKFELDPFGVTAITNRKIGDIPEARYVALCPWPNIPLAASHLRTHCMGPELRRYAVLSLHLNEACSHLDIPERSANDARLPSRVTIRCGTLFRLDAGSAKALRCYFSLPNIVDLTEPAIAELGADSYLIYAAVRNPEEPFRTIMTSQLFLAPAQKELTRWIRSHSHKRQEALSTKSDDK